MTLGDVSGGGVTDDVLGLINPAWEKITGITNGVLAGKELTPEQLGICEFLMRKGPSIDAMGDIMAVNGQIDIDLANAHLQAALPARLPRLERGNFWKPDHEDGRLDAGVTENATRREPRLHTDGPIAAAVSAPQGAPPSSPGDNSGRAQPRA